jgi:hypothetical protein
MANLVEQNRKRVYDFFDNHVVPLLKDDLPETEEELNQIADTISKKMKDFRWHLRKYDNTYRLSAHANHYLYFMVWTPDGLEEYTNWEAEYHGSRRRNDA